MLALSQYTSYAINTNKQVPNKSPLPASAKGCPHGAFLSIVIAFLLRLCYNEGMKTRWPSMPEVSAQPKLPIFPDSEPEPEIDLGDKASDISVTEYELSDYQKTINEIKALLLIYHDRAAEANKPRIRSSTERRHRDASTEARVKADAMIAELFSLSPDEYGETPLGLISNRVALLKEALQDRVRRQLQDKARKPIGGAAYRKASGPAYVDGMSAAANDRRDLD